MSGPSPEPVQEAVERFESIRDTLRAVDYDDIEGRMAPFAALEPAALSRVVEILGFRPERSRKRNVALLCRVLQGIKSRQRRIDLIGVR